MTKKKFILIFLMTTIISSSGLSYFLYEKSKKEKALLERHEKNVSAVLRQKKMREKLKNRTSLKIEEVSKEEKVKKLKLNKVNEIINGLCEFKNLSKDMVLYHVSGNGKRSNYQLTDEYAEADKINILINSPSKPVGLILGTYQASVWELIKTKNTKIEAVYLTGYESQLVVGLDKESKLIVSAGNNAPCGKDFIEKERHPKAQQKIKEKLEKIFNKKIEKNYIQQEKTLFIGDEIFNEKDIVSTGTKVDDFIDESIRGAGKVGLQELVNNGSLKKVDRQFMQDWKEKNADRLSEDEYRYFGFQGGYIIQKEIIIPNDLYGSDSVTFLLKKGVPKPTGKLGHSKLFKMED